MGLNTYLYCAKCGFHYPAGAVASPTCPDCRGWMRIWEDVGDGPPPQPEQYDDFGAPIDPRERTDTR